MSGLFHRRGGRARLWDGAIGTELIARGLDLGREPPEAWTLRRPDEVRSVHASYVSAGAQVLQTNTFGASRPRLEHAGLDGELATLNRDAVRPARAAEPALGCKGEPRGDDPARFARDTMTLVDEGADAVGGCCGAGPAHIAALARLVDAREASHRPPLPPGQRAG